MLFRKCFENILTISVQNVHNSHRKMFVETSEQHIFRHTHLYHLDVLKVCFGDIFKMFYRHFKNIFVFAGYMHAELLMVYV